MTQVKPDQGEGPPPAYPPPPDPAYPPPYQPPPPQGYQPPPQGQGYGPPPQGPGYGPPPKGQGYGPPPQGQGYGPPRQGQGYQQPYQQQPGYSGHHAATTVVVQQPGYGPQPGSTCRYYSAPAMIVCQHCQATVTTSTEFSVGTYAWLIAGIVLIFGCWLGCCLIPFCIDSCKDVVHTCPNCRCVVGRYTRL